MAEHESLDAIRDEDGKRHEPDTLWVGSVTWAVVALAAIVVLTAALMNGMDDLFLIGSRRTERAEKSAARPEQVVAATPLDPTQPTELRELRAAEKQTLTTYGWVDRKDQIARIPIDRAIRLMAERGLSGPVRGGDAANARKPATKPGAQKPREEHK